MKIFPGALIIALLMSACGSRQASPTPMDVPAMQTMAVETAYAMLTAQAPTVTATSTPLPEPTATPTASPTATPDYSKIKFETIYFLPSTQLVLNFTLNGVRGTFRMTGNEYAYECLPVEGKPDELRCTGPFQATGREVTFSLFEAGRSEAVFLKNIIIPSMLPPTPEGMYCENEPLWTSFPGQFDEGCYSVTCYVNGYYYGGTPNTCEKPWIWPVP